MGIGDWANPQSPIPKTQTPNKKIIFIFLNLLNKKIIIF